MTVAIPAMDVAGRAAAHGQRSALRRLLAGLMDSWDAGDAISFAAHFGPTGTWRDPGGRRSVGTAEIQTHFTEWRAWEPWSLHWLSNENAPAATVGTWLWSAASTVDGGSLGAWSGGDLAAEVAMTPSGWRLESLEMSDRYRTPYAEGWLATPHLQPRPPAEPAALAPEASVAVPTYLPPGEEHLADLDALTAELDVRHLMGDFVHAAETGRPGIETARHWMEEGQYLLIDAGGKERQGKGRAAVAALVDADRQETSSHLQALMSESITLNGERATGRWRDLWVAERQGEARWVAHQYVVDARRDGNRWQFEKVVRRQLLDCSYADGWATEPARGAR